MFAFDPWYSRLFPDFRELTTGELPAGVSSGCEFTGICINTAIYLPWLVGQCRKLGVVFRRGGIAHIGELRGMHHTGGRADIIINATGLGAKSLGGVEDQQLMPIRGQIVLVENETSPMYNVSGTDDVEGDISYVMTRAAGGGTVLGGTYQKGNWDTTPDPETTGRIIRRCVDLSPNLTGGRGPEAVKVIRSSVGLRPYRESGVRIDADLDTLEDGTLIVHNYGHGGWGYQGSYGCAEHVVELVDKFLQGELSSNQYKARL